MTLDHMGKDSIGKTSAYESPQQLYEELLIKVQKYHPSDDLTLIQKAYEVAARLHKDQVRKSGEPYIIHPLCAAHILADYQNRVQIYYTL